ncbi:nucleoside triphosphate pyrophosphohydrolase [Chelatococcus reniformis]|uniref:Nucleoside triphosphate pyrophosphohydrolase n=1 Tax=Chelatococcus reniformis TaxID=1494448 RepID=A0A916U268_9HYPH|nr:nucleoside triphosphate pyrophosphohydrolase [Chelatococcus reniformis]GGC55807.1 nucleoside triphosphate pyrophosphohydrolase [Chelatococcus reniformis]
MTAASQDMADLLAIMARLRAPEGGCAWDLAQTFATIAPYTVEEAYEVADAIARGDLTDLRDELGDLLLQVVFHARMAEEGGAFAFGDVVEAISAKMIRRHPHVFGDVSGLSADEVSGLWAAIKAQEKAERRVARIAAGLPEEDGGLLAAVPANVPALTRAHKLQAKAATVGFDWPHTAQVIDKIAEELDEVRGALADGDPAAVGDEIGDLLFAVVNLARHAGIDPEVALRGTNDKFTRRFRHVEQAIESSGKSMSDADLDEMEAHWVAAKRGERTRD